MADITITAGSSNSTVPGTDGPDNVIVNELASNVTVNLLAGIDTFGSANNGVIVNSKLSFGDGNDILFGGTSSGTIVYGNVGDDNLTFATANALNQTAFGGQGDDTIRASAGSGFQIYGNLGSDTINIAGTDGSSKVYGGQGVDQITGSNAGSAYIDGGLDDDNIQGGSFGKSTLIGNSGNDTIVSNGAGDKVYGNVGSDSITLNATNTTAFGGQDNDTIRAVGNVAGTSVVYGNLGNDLINIGAQGITAYGGGGSDTLVGSDDDAVLVGGLDSDTFVVNAGGQGQTATISDFATGADKVAFGGAATNAVSTDNYTELASSSVTSADGAATAAANAGNNTYTFVAGAADGYVVYNDGNGNGATVATLTGVNTTAGFASGDIKTTATAT